MMKKLLIVATVAVTAGSFGGAVAADGKGPSGCSAFVPGTGVAEAANGAGFSGDANPSGFVAFFCNPNSPYNS